EILWVCSVFSCKLPINPSPTRPTARKRRPRRLNLNSSVRFVFSNDKMMRPTVSVHAERTYDYLSMKCRCTYIPTRIASLIDEDSAYHNRNELARFKQLLLNERRRSATNLNRV